MTLLLTNTQRSNPKKYAGTRLPHAPSPSLLTRAKNVGYGEAMLDFLEQRRAKGNADHSLETVKSKLHRFGAFLESAHLGLADIREAIMDKYLIHRRDVDGVGDIARHSDGVQIKAFVRHCARRGYIKRDYLTEWTPPKHDKPYRKMPAPAEILRLLQAVEDKCKPERNPCRRHRNRESQGFYTSRDQSLIAVATDGGLRPAEYFALRPEDYDRANKQLIVRYSKSGKPRYVPISDHTTAFLDAWIKHRPDEEVMRELDCWQGEDEDGRPLRPTLFVTDGGTPMAVTSWSRQFKRYCQWAGIEEITPYNLRHFNVTKMAQVNPLAAQNQAGHSDLRVTMTYIHNSADHNRAAHAKADPLGQVMGLIEPPKPKRRSLIKR
jgi:integrase